MSERKIGTLVNCNSKESTLDTYVEPILNS